MRTSLIINTAALDPFVAPITSMYAHSPYSVRAGYLRDIILPAARKDGWDEIIVCGTFEEGEGYQYVPMEPIYRDRRDALWQREYGARHATGDILAFSHDDHMFEEGILSVLPNLESWDILVPGRRTRGGTVLNNGKAESYMGGHSLFMKRTIWAKAPWTSVDTEWWDRTMTRVWREEGARIVWTEQAWHVDLDEPTLTD